MGVVQGICQTRHLTSLVNKVFALFQEEYQKVKIGWSQFASLHSADVLLSNGMCAFASIMKMS